MMILGVDIGGTFTDFVLLDTATRRIWTEKQLTDPGAPDRVVLEGTRTLLARCGIGASDVAYVVHGTTLVTNAVIERRGSPTWLITTRGFRDVIEIGREKRYDIYDLRLSNPKPLVERARRLELDERTDAQGQVVREPSREALRVLVSDLPEGEKAIAVVLLHAWRNPASERQVGAWLREVLGANAAISLSCDVSPEMGEYERTSTTLINAYVQPLVSSYLDRLEGALAEMGIQAPPLMMLSHGGLGRFRLAKELPVRILESGPAGGAAVAAYVAESLGIDRALAFDMGGTTAKICFIDDYRPEVVADGEVARMNRFKKGSGLPVRVPMVDLIEIGAGGGSIADCNALGMLAVGPRSAGSTPGPACYGRGGQLPTVTDANLLLGYYDPQNFLGGEMALDERAARAAFSGLAERVGKTLTEVAWAIQETVNQNMVRAAQLHAFDTARELAEYTMICSGGAAPAHACRVARELGVLKVVVPTAAGVASSLGFLVAPMSIDLRRSVLTPLSNLDHGAMASACASMRAEASGALVDVGVESDDDSVATTLSVEARFVGQAHSLVLDVAESDLGNVSHLREAFRAKYLQSYGDCPSRADIEITALRLRMQKEADRPASVARERSGDRRAGAARLAFFPETGLVLTPVCDRDALEVGDRRVGPVIVQERDTTIVVPPGAVAQVDESGNLIIDLGSMEVGA
ncbi:hydantoinase/oxoprolinase family protein [Hydrogenophaga sp.]|uniref:hydantoinase/oxoprolinase family protein n=1 Tax=Hydrogenophaga sp. TaxID=1904254 RepID=UPI003F71F1AE